MNLKKMQQSIVKRMQVSQNGCWEYNLALRKNGYARITFERKSWYAHRLSYVAFGGTLIDGSDICHSCDNRKCVNPAHLFQGTRKDNMIDAKSKNRLATGFNLPQTKLSQSDINNIIKDGVRGLMHKDIAQKYNVTRSLVTYYINKNKQLMQEK